MTAGSSDELLTLGEAATRLNVHPTTLRRWADNGDVLVMVTPGGHRRFPVREIERLVGDRVAADSDIEDIGSHLVSAAVLRAKRDMAMHPARKWATEFDAGQREHLRDMGRQVMQLLEQFVDTDDNDSLLSQAKTLGETYAESAKSAGMSLPGVMQAVLFFRDHIIESAAALPDTARLDDEGQIDFFRRINTFLNSILLSVAEAYE